MAKTSKNILDEARSTIKQIDIDEARRMLDKPGTVLVDVREPDEWRQGHIPQAVAISRGFRFILRHRDDSERELTLTVLAFEVPA